MYAVELEKVIASMRKIECFGYNKWPINFEFPTAEDFRRMTKKINIKIKDFKYK
jgi:hypothetical protein